MIEEIKPNPEPVETLKKNNLWLPAVAFVMVKLAVCVVVVRFLFRNSEVPLVAQLVIAFAASFLLGVVIDLIWRLTKKF